MAPEAAPGRCARHPAAAASRACARCGDFSCPACVDPEYPALCPACAARLPHGVAWEDRRAGRLPWRFARTLWQLLRRPAFGGPASAAPALGFAAACGAGLGALVLAYAAALRLAGAELVAPTLERMTGLALATSAALVAGGFVGGIFGIALIQAASFALGLQAAARPRGALRHALRVGAYAQGLLLWLLAARFVTGALALALPEAPAAAALDLHAWPPLALDWVLGSARLWLAAGRGLGLSPPRAALAAFGPTLLAGLAAAAMLREFYLPALR